MDQGGILDSTPMPLGSTSQTMDTSVSESSFRVETQTTQAPHNAVKAEKLSVFAGSRCLLAEADLTLAERIQTSAGQQITRGMCYGLVGPNGCGKSTLLKLISTRSVPTPSSWDVFLVDQHLPQPLGRDPVEEVLSADANRAKLLELQASLEEEMMKTADTSAEEFSKTNDRLLEVESELFKWEGCERTVADLLLALGFRGSDGAEKGHVSVPTISTPMSQLSGGWRMKVQLAKALWLRPRLLLLDEPTNHLDFRALGWLQQKLEEYPHTIVVVSHDVSFLHSACKEILWMKDQKLEALPRDMVSQEDILRMQRRRALRFSFSTPNNDDVENHGLSLHGVEFSYGSDKTARKRTPLLRVNDDIRFSGKSRAVLLGKNGCGKSTFLDICSGKLSPTRGIVDHTAGLKIGHYSQLTDELDRSEDTAAAFIVRQCRDALAGHVGSTHSTRLRETRAVRARQKDAAAEPCTGDAMAAMRERAAEDRVVTAAAQEKRLTEIARGVLTHFGFEGDLAVSVPVSRLSGGQKACLKFAVLSLQPVHILLLDEPTNHLDAEASEALARGLSEFKGGIIAVTHDETLIYRLIHCNWTTSELLTCQNGVFRKAKEVGASCLNALKDELRNAEESEEKTGSQHRQKAKGSRKAEEKPTVTVQANGTVVVKSTVVKSALPPWLQAHCRRPNRRRIEDATQEQPLADQENIPVTTVKESTHVAPISGAVPSCSMDSIACNATSDMRVVGRRQQLSQHDAKQRASRTTALAPEPAENLMVLPRNDAPESWEDISTCDDDDDASRNVCRPTACTPEVVDLVSPPAACDRREAKVTAEQKEGRPGVDRHVDETVAESDSKHSRFRKDLVNLNKAVAKWLRQESKGEISHASVEEKIRNSVAAKELRTKHGAEFREEDFVRDALQHAANKAGRTQV